MYKWTISSLIFFVVLLFGLREIGAYLWQHPQALARPNKINTDNVLLDENKLFDLVNIYRQSKGLSMLTKSVVTCGIATLRVNEIQNDFSHDGFRRNSQKWINSYNLSYLGENLAEDYSSEEIVLSKWLKSSKHRENLMDDYSYSCMRCKNNKCVQIFAK